MEIKITDPEIVFAIYEVACNYEKIKVIDNNPKKSFYDEVEKRCICGYGLEYALADFICCKNDFLCSDDSSLDGKFGWIHDNYGMEPVSYNFCEIE